MSNSRTCKKCSQIRPLIEFEKNKRCNPPYTHRCIDCAREYFRLRARRLYAENPEAAKARTLRYRTKHPEKVQAKLAKWRANNAEHRKEYQLGYVAKNKQKLQIQASNYRKSNRQALNQQAAKWRQANPEKQAAIQARRRARVLNGAVALVTGDDFKKLKLRPCLYCGSSKKPTIDHVIPLAKGGSHTIGNLITLCGICNSTKKDKYWIEFRIYMQKMGRANGQWTVRGNSGTSSDSGGIS